MGASGRRGHRTVIRQSNGLGTVGSPFTLAFTLLLVHYL